jgi:hypothetical protein
MACLPFWLFLDPENSTSWQFLNQDFAKACQLGIYGSLRQIFKQKIQKYILAEKR